MMKSRRMIWAGHVARMRGRLLVGRQGVKRPLERPRRRWVGNIKIDLREIGCGGMDGIDLAQDRNHWKVLVDTVMNLRVPENIGKFASR
jgi:hypothetical protein